MTNDIWWWLTATHPEICAAGLDPDSRVLITGHTRALSLQWARSVGMWGHEPARTIMRYTKAARGTYNNFKIRHAVSAAKETTSNARIQLFCEAAYMQIETDRDGQGLVPDRSVGETARMLMKQNLQPGAAPVRFGPLYHSVRMLPVEIVLYHTAMRTVLMANEITMDHYLGAEDLDREVYWRPHNVLAMTRAPSRMFL
jgi:hypothetical protein